MVDVVYNCRTGKNEELRYSMRSAYDNLNYDNLWVVGGKPDWYAGNFVEQEWNKSKEVRERLGFKAIVGTPEIEEDFILMNDDFYVLQKIDQVVNWNGGLLKDKVKIYDQIAPVYSYTLLLKQTYNYLISQGIKDPLDYEMHTPMVMNKTNLSYIVDMPMLTRSLYGNMFNVESEQHKDVKVYPRGQFSNRTFDMNQETPYLSSMDETFNEIFIKILNDRFKTPTPYES